MNTFLKLSGCLSAICIFAVWTSGCERTTKTSQQQETTPHLEHAGNVLRIPKDSPLRAKLVIEKVESRETRVTRHFTGTIGPDPARFARVYPPVAGKIARLHVTLGDKVGEGQPLATLYAPDYQEAQNGYLKAKSSFNLASRILLRQKELKERKVASLREVEAAEIELTSAEADLKAADELLRFMGFDPENDQFGQPLVVSSPLTGKVVELAATAGEFRNDNAAEIAAVADLSVVWLTLNVPERDLGMIRKDDEVEATLEAFSGDLFKGALVAIGDVIEAETRTVQVRAELANPDGRLRPGMYASVSVRGLPAREVVVPRSAIVQVGGDSFIYEEVSEGVLQSRAVKLGADVEDGGVVVLEGLKAGARILAQNAVLLP